jgi:hypothetical protein
MKILIRESSKDILLAIERGEAIQESATAILEAIKESGLDIKVSNDDLTDLILHTKNFINYRLEKMLIIPDMGLPVSKNAMLSMLDVDTSEIIKRGEACSKLVKASNMNIQKCLKIDNGSVYIDEIEGDKMLDVFREYISSPEMLEAHAELNALEDSLNRFDAYVKTRKGSGLYGVNRRPFDLTPYMMWNNESSCFSVPYRAFQNLK